MLQRTPLRRYLHMLGFLLHCILDGSENSCSTNPGAKVHKTAQHTMEVVICTYIDSNTEVNIYSGPLTLVCSLSFADDLHYN